MEDPAVVLNTAPGGVGAPDDPGPTVGERLREARKATGRTQSEVAAKLGVARRSVYEWERDVRLPSQHLPQLASLYQTTVSQLLYGVEPASEELRRLRDEVARLTVLVHGLAAATEASFAELRRLAEERLRQEG